MARIRAKTKEIDGIKFDSQKEARRYQELKLLEKAGEIRNLQCHPKYPLEIDGRPIRIRSDRYPNGRTTSYTADFGYDEKSGVAFGIEGVVQAWEPVVEDVKGFDTPASRLRRAVWEAIYGMEIRIIK